ncbi:lipid A biosynthesis acyltransferase [Chlorobium phaeovibrioides]|uniref:Lipid A biosynthesis acyltransferase n=1 Tax=Chlorobium phaeovibrioides TaxID=1094 RepID=A0A3S0L1W7_CHLPH|nr:lysophospholipid acyltransferase family protein [Chlorobium phaeovibrioides]RTY38380.1 lipid A biosynthesis acyltransferase [Chlorobium phaeovibrioides]
MSNRNSFVGQVGAKAAYRLFMLLGVLVRAVPRGVSNSVAHRIGDFAFSVLRIRRALVEGNLALSFPDKQQKETRRMARQVYRNQAENFIEVLRIPLVKNREDAKRLITIDAGDFLRLTRDRGKGAVLVSAHFGNWELLGLCVGMLISPLTIIVKRLRNREIDLKINEWRSLRGNRMVHTHNSLREGLRTLKSGGILAILADQSDPEETFFAPFLGRTTSVVLGPAFFALKAEVPLFLGVSYRTGKGRYTVEMKEIPTDGLTTAKEDVEELARRYTKELEAYIYRYPEEWFWLHNRWKRTRPGDVDPMSVKAG